MAAPAPVHREFALSVLGIKDLAATFRKAVDQALPKALSDANKGAAKVVADYARALAPRGKEQYRAGHNDGDKHPGRLAAQVRATATKTAAYVRAGGRDTPYVDAVHWGWKRHGIARNPFVYTAFEAKKEEATAHYDDELRRMLGSIGLA